MYVLSANATRPKFDYAFNVVLRYSKSLVKKSKVHSQYNPVLRQVLTNLRYHIMNSRSDFPFRCRPLFFLTPQQKVRNSIQRHGIGCLFRSHHIDQDSPFVNQEFRWEQGRSPSGVQFASSSFFLMNRVKQEMTSFGYVGKSRTCRE